MAECGKHVGEAVRRAAGLQGGWDKEKQYVAPSTHSKVWDKRDVQLSQFARLPLSCLVGDMRIGLQPIAQAAAVGGIV